jgi:DNA-binding transcriptional LysR family regulator
MDLDQLRTFDRIVRDLSFTRAAAHLNITQATASMRIRALEQLLGVTLFVRGRQVTLTDQGMTFLPYARRIIGTAQEGREALRRVERGRVSIASLRTLVTPLITESLIRFQEKYPAVDVVVREGRQAQIAAMLHEREAEMGILCWPNIDPLVVDLEPLVIMRERVPLVVSADVAARLSSAPSIDEVLALVPRSSRCAGGRPIPKPPPPWCGWPRPASNCPPARRGGWRSRARGWASSSIPPLPRTSGPDAWSRSPRSISNPCIATPLWWCAIWRHWNGPCWPTSSAKSPGNAR